jgi:20S proteasome subunit alpha 3
LSPHQGNPTDTGVVEFATVGKTKEGKIYHHLWSGEEIMALLREHGLAKEEEADSG